nr:hypothetical protein HmN_000970700 [Hymenolepis microstoma]
MLNPNSNPFESLDGTKGYTVINRTPYDDFEAALLQQTQPSAVKQVKKLFEHEFRASQEMNNPGISGGSCWWTFTEPPFLRNRNACMPYLIAFTTKISVVPPIPVSQNTPIYLQIPTDPPSKHMERNPAFSILGSSEPFEEISSFLFINVSSHAKDTDNIVTYCHTRTDIEAVTKAVDFHSLREARKIDPKLREFSNRPTSIQLKMPYFDNL